MRHFRPALTLLALMTLTLGVIYPLLVTGISVLLFPRQASGSLLHNGNTLVGSKLIGQHFSEPKYFWGRPSATTPQPYNGAASGASNLGPLNPALLDQVDRNIKALRALRAQDGNTAAAGAARAGAAPSSAAPSSAAPSNPVPVDLVSASASGLDPDISVAAAEYQVARVAKARGMAPAAVEAIIGRLQTGALLGIIGESQINVLELNMALDGARNE
jgi:potassium-transporting ATPase KdpC subunit